MVEDKGGQRLAKLLADSLRARRVEGMREADEMPPPTKRPRNFSQLQNVPPRLMIRYQTRKLPAEREFHYEYRQID